MSDGMRRELMYLSSYATNRYFIPNWGIIISLCAKRSQQGGCHGYNNLYNDFPNTNFSHNI